MVIMKIQSNNSGVALIVLIFAITILSVLAASFASFVGARHKGVFYQINSYRALNIANAGMEYAIKYASEETQKPNSDLFKANPFVLQLDGKFYGFDASGIPIDSVKITYTFNQDISGDNVTVEGRYRESKRQVVLHRFRYYAFENLTRVPGSVPVLFTNYIIIPIIFNPNKSGTTSETVVRMGVFFIGGSSIHLQNIFLQNSTNIPPPVSEQKYDYITDSNFSVCPTGDPYCRDAGQGIKITSNDSHYEPYANSFQLSTSFLISESDRVRWCIIQFNESTPQLNGQYRVTYYNSSGVAIGTLNFKIP
ncbi:MAG: hypothetical protein ACYDH2_15500 [Anaerolineaceae bacterium]